MNAQDNIFELVPLPPRRPATKAPPHDQAIKAARLFEELFGPTGPQEDESPSNNVFSAYYHYYARQYKEVFGKSTHNRRHEGLARALHLLQGTTSKEEVIRGLREHLIPTESNMAKDDIAVPNTAESNIADPNMAESNIAEPNTAEGDIAEPIIAEDDTAEPNIAEDNIGEPNMAESNIAGPSIAEPVMAEPKIVEHDLVKQSLQKVVELAGRIAVMHELQRWNGRGQSSPEWKAEQSLTECLGKYYSGPELQGTVRLERGFNAQSIERIAGFEIKWTHFLERHLSLQEKDNGTVVWIFSHTTYLKAMLNGKLSTLFPANLADETLRTLALLFPRGDRNVKKWYLKKVKAEEYELDRTVTAYRKLTDAERDIDKFYFWRDRLLLLKQEYDAAEPSTLSHWWFDTRKKVQWATFWLAAWVLVLTVVFGCIQSIEGALQVYKAYHPTQP